MVVSCSSPAVLQGDVEPDPFVARVDDALTPVGLDAGAPVAADSGALVDVAQVVQDAPGEATAPKADTGPVSVDAGQEAAAAVDAGAVLRCRGQFAPNTVYMMVCGTLAGDKIEIQDRTAPIGPNGYPYVWGCYGAAGSPCPVGGGCRVWTSSTEYRPGVCQ